MHNSVSPFFSVIIPTRNRASLFEAALESVMAQTFSDVEIIVVNDGTSGKQLEEYRLLEAKYPVIKFHYLVQRPNGHGSSYAMNFGVEQSNGSYVTFLDDDDYWTDEEHLARASRSIKRAGEVDVYYTNQAAYYPNGEKRSEGLWLNVNALNDKLDGLETDAEGTCMVDTEVLIGTRSFAHFNCSIFRKAFFHELGGLDENIRYENDRDLFIRTVDTAEKMLFNPRVVSRHNIPDRRARSNMSTVITERQKRLFQLQVLEKGVLFSAHPAVRAYCIEGKGNQLKLLARDLDSAGEYRHALHYAQQALAVLPTLRWRLYTALLRLRALWH